MFWIARFKFELIRVLGYVCLRNVLGCLWPGVYRHVVGWGLVLFGLINRVGVMTVLC